MILCISPNPAIDRALFVNSLEDRGTIRARAALDCVGGKGADTALVLSRLGVAHCLVSFMAGEYGHILEKLYRDYSIQSDLIWVKGETRTVTVIIEDKDHTMTQISQPGFPITQADRQVLMDKIRQKVDPGTWVIAAGSLPPGAALDFYKEIALISRTAGSKFLLDASGEILLQALPARPHIIKMNHQEFHSSFDLARQDDIEGVCSQALKVIKTYDLEAMVVTLGKNGVLLIRAGEVLHARGPIVQAVNPAGAGDAVSAALAARLQQGEPWSEALRWACAAGTSATLTAATADCSLEVIKDLLPQIEIMLISVPDN